MTANPQHDSSCWITEALSEYESRLLRYVYGLVGDIHIARELVQETFLRLCSQPREQVEPHLASWLFRVSRNAAIDHLRKEKRMQTADLEALEPIVSGGEQHSVADQVEQKEVAASVGSHLKNLPVNQQEVLRLRFEHQMSYKQIAEVTGHTTSNVGFMIHTAIKKLRTTLEFEGNRFVVAAEQT